MSKSIPLSLTGGNIATPHGKDTDFEQGPASFTTWISRIAHRPGKFQAASIEKNATMLKGDEANLLQSAEAVTSREDLRKRVEANLLKDTRDKSGEDSGSLVEWLAGRGVTVDRTLVITIANSRYLPAVYNLQEHLKKWGRDQDLLVLCLDLECTESSAAHSYGGFVKADAAVMHSVAHIKVHKTSYISTRMIQD